MIKNINTALKGFAMGAANVVPGVSGGTIALLTGIYSNIINSLNAFINPNNWKLLFSGKFKEFWVNTQATFMLYLMVGVLLSIISLAKLMAYIIVYYPIQTWAFFFGLIIASSLYLLWDIKLVKTTDAIWTIIGMAFGIILCTLTPTQTPNDLWFIFICGAIAICTMILPGISGSFILVLLGKYEYIMQSITQLNIPVLLAFCLGCGVGILAFAKFLHWLLAKYEKPTMLILIGFIIGALIKVWPWSDKKAIIMAHFLNLNTPKDVAEVLTNTTIANGLPINQVINMHYGSAILFCFLGVLLVLILETISKRIR